MSEFNGFVELELGSESEFTALAELELARVNSVVALELGSPCRLMQVLSLGVALRAQNEAPLPAELVFVE